MPFNQNERMISKRYAYFEQKNLYLSGKRKIQVKLYQIAAR